jgi:hypothetical protein
MKNLLGALVLVAVVRGGHTYETEIEGIPREVTNYLVLWTVCGTDRPETPKATVQKTYSPETQMAMRDWLTTDAAFKTGNMDLVIGIFRNLIKRGSTSDRAIVTPYIHLDDNRIRFAAFEFMIADFSTQQKNDESNFEHESGLTILLQQMLYDGDSKIRMYAIGAIENWYSNRELRFVIKNRLSTLQFSTENASEIESLKIVAKLLEHPERTQ